MALAAVLADRSAAQVTGIAPVGSIPTADDPIDYYVGDQEMYDSNLYRLPGYVSDISTLVAPNATREDYINTAFVGFDGLWAPGLQQIVVNLRAADNRFAHNDELNNYSANADLLWNWRAGASLSGQAGGDYQRALANFSETLYLGRDVVNSYDAFGNARYQIGPHWAVYAGIREIDSRHAAVAADYNDYQSNSGFAGIELATSAEDTVGLEYQYMDGRFDHGQFLFDGLPFDRDFNQNTLSVVAKYVVSDKTTINATGSYVKRAYTNQSEGAFSGNTWNLSLVWQLTDKTQIIFNAYRQLQAYLSSQSDFFVGTGGSIAPTWLASEKLSFKLVASYANQNYIPTSPSVLILGTPRHDKISAAQAVIGYTPIRALTFNVYYTKQHRDSDQPEFGFDDQQAVVTATFKF